MTEQQQQSIIQSTEEWLERFVIGLELCPFARRPWQQGQISISVVEGDDPVPIINDIVERGQHMLSPEASYQTALLVCPDWAYGFEEMYVLVDDMQLVCDQLELEVQLVAFHPEFRYQDADPDDPANATNRSPYPMIHILRSQDLEDIREGGYDISGLTDRNESLLKQMGWTGIKKIYEAE